MTDNDQYSDSTFRERLKQNPGPALVWTAIAVALIALQLGALGETIMGLPWDLFLGGIGDIVTGFLEAATGILPAVLGGALSAVVGGISAILLAIAGALAAIGDAVASLPTLLTRELIPNQGYNNPNTPGWESTFLGLSPAIAWLIRFALVYAYAITLLAWAWRGFQIYRQHYRYADWTPADDIIDRFRGHSWGLFGLIAVFVFLVLGIFAPTLAPTTLNANIMNPYSHQTTYWSEQTGSVQQITVGAANIQSKSVGASSNVGIWSYDKFDRFHPLGTLPTGKDMFTSLAYGGRVSLFVGLVALSIAGGIAIVLALLTAYYKGLFDLVTVVASDAQSSMPFLLVVIMLSVIFNGSWIAQIYSGALLLAVLFGLWGWMGLWRAVRGPAFQVVESEWVDAAESFGEKPRVLVRKHVAPYTIGYLLIYGSMSIGGYMIAAAGLAFLGLGVTAPTPAWGRMISAGQSLLNTQSWHISIVPGLAITIVVLGFNALGDGIRDALDPQTESEGAAEAETAAAGGGA
jgi:peptide/nickel transport system permease protein